MACAGRSATGSVGRVVYAGLMARMLEPALRDLVATIGARERGDYDPSPLFEATVRTADEGAAFYARVSLRRPLVKAHRVQVHVWAWSVNQDLARYVGGHPPVPEHLDPLHAREATNPSPDNDRGREWSKTVTDELCALVDGFGAAVDESGVPSFFLRL